MSKKIDISDLTSKDIEEELKRLDYNSKYIKILKSTIYSLITIAAVAVLVATMVLPVLQVSGSSMSPILDSGDIVVSVKTSKLKQGDIIAFYHGNKILVKRVIAKPGEWVNMDDNGQVYINGKKLKEPYIDELILGDVDIEFPYQVPDNHWFVLGDTTISPSSNVGVMDEPLIFNTGIIRVAIKAAIAATIINEYMVLVKIL